MKKSYFLWLCTFLYVSLSFGQATSDQKVTDKEKKESSLNIEFSVREDLINTLPPDYEVNQNQYIEIKLKDVNLFRYSVSLTEKQNNFINSTELSQGNTQIKIDPSTFGINDIELKVELSPIVLDKGIKNKIYEKRDKLDDLISNLDSLKLDNNKIVKKDTILLQDNSQYKKNSKKITELEDKISKEKKAILDIESRDNTFNGLVFNFNQKIEAYSKCIDSLNQMANYYQRFINTLYSDQPFEEIKERKYKIAREILKIEDVKELTSDAILKEAFSRLSKLSDCYYEIVKTYAEVKGASDLESGEAKSNEVKNNVEIIYSKIVTFNNQINKSVYNDFFKRLATVYDAINETNFNLTYYTLIVSDNADIINYDLKLTPFTNLPYSIETKPINYKYNVKIKGGVKIDVSTGIFFNIGLADHRYRFEQAYDENHNAQAGKSVLIRGNDWKSQFDPSLGVLFNVYKRSDSDFKVGWNVGISTNTERLNYYTGVSFLIGKSERINFNLGLAGAQVKTVVDTYDVKEGEYINMDVKDLPKDVPLMNPSPFRLGMYIGVSFNLLGTKNKETLSQITVK
ncbi:hypothetical protein ACG2LH_16535 [Zhouia sp. PK063]|uniref:hypothetical protein n=1 Tax=Zhouia sp. PK063 TaxID=3373602 RepID=UPI0037B66185